MKLRNSFFILPFALLFACSSNGTPGFELKGKLTNAPAGSVYLELLSPTGQKNVDTAQINDKGEYSFDYKIPEIGFYRLKLSEQSFATLILEPDQKVTVNGDATDLGNTYTVEGSPDSKFFWELNKASARNYSTRDSLQKHFQQYVASINAPGHTMTKQDSINIETMSNQLEKPYSKLVSDHNLYLKNFIEKNNTSFASLAAIQQLQPEEYLETFFKLDEGLYGKYPNSSYIQAFHTSVSSQRKLANGTAAPEISMQTPDGKTLALSSLKGKYVLVDFWASWCGPCRAENPNVVKAYKKYNAKGFEIFSVSLDKDKEKWIAAIQKDGLTWPSHVSDLMHWQSPVVQLYNFSGIPYNVLLDKEGKIIAKNLRGEALEQKLSEIIK